MKWEEFDRIMVAGPKTDILHFFCSYKQFSSYIIGDLFQSLCAPQISDVSMIVYAA